MKKYLLFLLIILAPGLALASNFERDLFFGMKNNDEVKELQKFLVNQGVYQGPANGNFFSLTREAVKKFQEKQNIKPVKGYFGPATREAANSLSGAFSKESLVLQLQTLQARLKEMKDKLLKETQVASSSAPVNVASTSVPSEISRPVFTKMPFVNRAGFLDNFPQGAKYPYRVVLNWEVDKTPLLESVTCSPTPKIPVNAGKQTEYFLEPRTRYDCNVSVKDQNGTEASADVSFTSPEWVSLSGNTSASFSGSFVTPFKIGEFDVYNGTSRPVVFSNFDVLISDEMDSTPNRSRKVQFLIREGTTSIDALISSTDFTFVASAPVVGTPYVASLNLPFGVTLAAGERKTLSLWAEQLLYVKSGTLNIKSIAVNFTESISVTGALNMTLTKAPDL